jgi:hypothetical protein
MTGSPTIKFTGAGSRQAAAKLGRTIADGVSHALAGRTEPLRIETLRIRLPAGAGAGALEQAIRAAIAGKTKSDRR